MSEIDAILSALADGPLRQAALESRLRAMGREDAIPQVLAAARAGIIAARDVHDAQGRYLEGEFARPEDVPSWFGM